MPVRSRRMPNDAIMIEVSPAELVQVEPGVIDVFDALARQFFWADIVMLASPPEDAEVLEGEIVDP